MTDLVAELRELVKELRKLTTRPVTLTANAIAHRLSAILDRHAAPEDAKLYWCNAHQRRAQAATQCDPRLGGITMPCRVVELTGKVEIAADT